MRVMKEGKSWIVVSKLGVLKHSGDGLIFIPDVQVYNELPRGVFMADPLPGFLIIGDCGKAVDKVPPLFVERNGLNHVLVGLDKENPIYAVYDDVLQETDVEIITSDFESYYTDNEQDDPHTRLQQVEALRKGVKVDGRKGYIVQYRDMSFVVAPVEKGVRIYKVPMVEVKKEYSIETLEKHKFVGELKIDPDLITNVEISGFGQLLFYLRDGRKVRWFSDNTVLVEWVKIRGESFGDVLFARKAFFLKDFTKPVEGAPRPRCGSCDVLGVIKKMIRAAPFFGPHVAMPTKRKIITRRGMLVIKKFPRDVPENVKRLVEWLLYMNDYYNGAFKRRVFPVVKLAPSGSEVVLEKMRTDVVKVGKFYYWAIDSKWAGAAGFSIGSSLRKEKKTLVVPWNFLLSRRFMRKVEAGQRVSVSDVIPGFPEGGKIKKNRVTVGVKSFDFKIDFVEKDGFWMLVPYADGVYRVFVGDDNEEDVWSPLFSTEVRAKKEGVFEFDFLRGARIQNIDAKFQNYRNEMQITLENGTVRIVWYDWDNFYIEVEIDGYKRVFYEDNAGLLLGLSNFEELKFFIISQ